MNNGNIQGIFMYNVYILVIKSLFILCGIIATEHALAVINADLHAIKSVMHINSVSLIKKAFKKHNR